MNNRIYKKVEQLSGESEITHYLRDAKGSTMAIYKEEAIEEFSLALGGLNGTYNSKTEKGKQTLGNKKYEFSNHLKNVLVVYTDNKYGDDTNLDSKVNVYNAFSVSQKDYLSFGAVTKGRNFENEEYRYTFNGKEMDKSTGWQNYGFRDYNPVYKRFDRIDPLAKDYPWYTPYQFAGNEPINAIDLDGLEPLDINGKPTTDPNKVHTYRVQAGQGFTQIAKDLQSIGYNVNWLDIMIFNEGEFGFVKHFKGSAVDKNNDEHRKLNMNPGDIIRVTRPFTTTKDMESSSEDDIPLLSRLALDGGFDFALLGGYGLHTGVIQDDNGEVGWYFTFNANVGVSGSAGIDVVPVFPSDGDKFVLDEWAGKGEEFNAQVGPLEIGMGKNVNDYLQGKKAENYYTGAFPYSNLPSKNVLSTVIKEGLKTGTGAVLDGEVGAGARYTFSQTWFIWRSDK